MPVSLTSLFSEAKEALDSAIKEDPNVDGKSDCENYKKAFEKFNKYREEFDKIYYHPYCKKLEEIAGVPGSSMPDTAQLWPSHTYSSPKSSHFVKLSNVELDDVAGLEGCKQVLMEAAIWPKKYPQFFTGNRKPWRAVLLFGPPGSGKTLLAKAIATKAKFHFSSISPSDIVSKWMGESEQRVSDLFQEACKKEPSIIFIDEIDSLCGTRGKNNENEASRRIKSELLVHMQGVCDGDKHVLILAATNTPDDLDQAIRRRFDMRMYIPLPNPEARKRIFEVQIGKTPNKIGKEELKYLAEDTEGFSGSDISYYVKDALYQSIRPTLRKLEEDGQNSEIQVPKIKLRHFTEVRKRHKPTVKKKDLERFEKFEEFGVSGEM